MNQTFPQRQEPYRKGFTLIELLTVIAIVSILAALSVGGLNHTANLMRGYNAEATFSGLLANARMEAVRQNTYVTVGFALYTSDDRNYVAMIMVAAKNGADLFESTNSVTLTKNDLMGRITVFENFALDNAPDVGIPRPGLPDGVNPARLSSTYEIRVAAPGFPQSPLIFGRVLRFNPSGEAFGDQSYSRLIEFGIHPIRSIDQILVAQINGLTGQSRVLKK